MNHAELSRNDPATARRDGTGSRHSQEREHECDARCAWGETERRGEKPDWYRTLFHVR